MPFPAGNLGPLPHIDRQDTVQRGSFTALRACLPEDDFVFRDERIDDKGVDLSLEVICRVLDSSDGLAADPHLRASNCRAQAQVKSTCRASANADGSISHSIETANLNHLLNGAAPIYFLWVAETNELRFAWAWDEWQRLDSENPNWRDQATFVIRFRSVLDANAILEVQARIFREAQLVRRTLETVSRSADTETVVVAITPATLTSTDPTQIYECLNKSGLTTVACGYGCEVIKAARFLNPLQAEEPRIQLVVSYALASLGRNHEALGCLSLAARRKVELTGNDREVLDQLRNACSYYTGQIGYDQFIERERAWASSQTDETSIERQIGVIRQKRLHERDLSRRADLLAELRLKVAELERADNAFPARIIRAKTVLLGCEGDELIIRFVDAITTFGMRAAIGSLTERSVRGVQRQLCDDWQAWFVRADDLVQAAKNNGHPILFADTLTTRLLTMMQQIVTTQMNAVSTATPWETKDESLVQLMREAELARDIYVRAGQVEGEARAKLVIANLLEMIGRTQEAAALAAEVANTSDAMSYAGLAASANEQLQGKAGLKGLGQSFANFLANEDFIVASKTDEEVCEVARVFARAANHPEPHFPVFEAECLLDRRMAIERTTFCRHLQISQSPMQKIDFLRKPPRQCSCALHKYVSNITHEDAETVIGVFKQQHCNGCPDIRPKERVDLHASGA